MHFLESEFAKQNMLPIIILDCILLEWSANAIATYIG